MDFVHDILMVGVGFVVLLVVIGLVFGPLWAGFSGIAPVDPKAPMDWHNLVGYVPAFAIIVAIVWGFRTMTNQNQQNNYAN